MERYDYSAVTQAKSKIKVTIGCNICDHKFNLTPNSHLRGQGCKLCSRKAMASVYKSNTSDFVEKAKKLHGVKFDYSLTEYGNNNTEKVKIRCNGCDQIFLQKPNHHLGGRGCPECSVNGFKKSKPGILYVLECGNITKVGITNDSAELRAAHVSNSFGDNFSVLATYSFESGTHCHKVERKLLNTLKKVYKQPTAKFHGYTECFLNVNVEELYAQIIRFREEVV